MVGWSGQFHRAHRLSADASRHPGAGERLHRQQRAGRCRADRRPDLHRWLGDAPSRAIRRLRPTWHAAPPRSATMGSRCTRRRCLRPWRPRHSWNGTSTSCSISGWPRSRSIRSSGVSSTTSVSGMPRNPTGARPGCGSRSDTATTGTAATVHVVPNHALMVLSLLYGDGDFGRTLAIITTAGWDTDCNAGNIGCLMGIRNGIDGIDGAGIDGLPSPAPRIGADPWPIACTCPRPKVVGASPTRCTRVMRWSRSRARCAGSIRPGPRVAPGSTSNVPDRSRDSSPTRPAPRSACPMSRATPRRGVAAWPSTPPGSGRIVGDGSRPRPPRRRPPRTCARMTSWPARPCMRARWCRHVSRPTLRTRDR